VLRTAYLQFDLNGTSPALRLFFNGTLFFEMPSPLVRKCRDRGWAPERHHGSIAAVHLDEGR